MLSSFPTVAEGKTRCTEMLNKVAVPSVNISSYITACQELLCHYPEVDNLYCHWVRAYADVAKVHNWQEKTSCSENLCAKHLCGSHEFCTVAPSAEASCYCQKTNTTINGYRQNGKYGPPPTCGADSRTITLLGCLLEEEGINFHGLHLNNPNCTGEVDQYNNVIFNWDSSNSCGEIFEPLSSGFSITQTLENTQSKTVTFENTFSTNISCVYNVDKLLNTFSLNVADGSIEFSYEMNQTFNLSTTLFTDAALIKPLELNTPLSLQQRLWLQVSAPELEGTTMTLVIEESWSTTDNDLHGANRYDLIKDGCPVTSDGTVELVSSGQGGEAVFSFEVFQYMNATSGPYLHTRVGLCVSGNNCTPDCA
uniref:ZP domain-containing protein n=1 Tax=Knipowitschia caucasica TaxID=637954 RepID=A0AAV2JGL6_KNICA